MLSGNVEVKEYLRKTHSAFHREEPLGELQRLINKPATRKGAG